MGLIEDLEREVSQEVDGMSVEVILALMDKWEEDARRAWTLNLISISELLNHYVRLKITWSKTKRDLEYRYTHDKAHLYNEKKQHYTNLISEARRKYYVAKRRYESEHASDCSCRSCRCIKGINSGC